MILSLAIYILTFAVILICLHIAKREPVTVEEEADSPFVVEDEEIL